MCRPSFCLRPVFDRDAWPVWRPSHPAEGDLPAIATHDLNLIARAKQLIQHHNIRTAEFQFFTGVRDSLARELVADGYNARIYIPCGNLWRFILDGFSSFDKWHQLQRMLHLRPRL